MRPLYHLVSDDSWNPAANQAYAAASLASEGFIHCSYREQAPRVANLFYAGATKLTALEIDPAKLNARVLEEDPGTGELFPHVYGPIDRAAIVAVRPLVRDKEGQWVWAEG